FFRFAFGFFYWCDHPFFRTIGIFWNRLFVRRTPKDMIAYAARCVNPSVVKTGTYPNAATARPVRRVERLPPAMPPIKVSATTRATCCGGVDSIISVVKLVFQEACRNITTVINPTTSEAESTRTATDGGLRGHSGHLAE